MPAGNVSGSDRLPTTGLLLDGNAESVGVVGSALVMSLNLIS